MYDVCLNSSVAAAVIERKNSNRLFKQSILSGNYTRCRTFTEEMTFCTKLFWVAVVDRFSVNKNQNEKRPFRVSMYQQFSLFGAGRPQVSAAVVVDAAFRRRRRRRRPAVHFLRVVRVDLFVVHVATVFVTDCSTVHASKCENVRKKKKQKQTNPIVLRFPFYSGGICFGQRFVPGYRWQPAARGRSIFLDRNRTNLPRSVINF